MSRLVKSLHISLHKGVNMKKISTRLKELPIEVELNDGTIVQMRFKSLNTKQTKIFAKIGEMDDEEIYALHIDLLKSNLVGDESLKQRLIEDLEEEGNIFEFISTLQEELGKLKKRG